MTQSERRDSRARRLEQLVMMSQSGDPSSKRQMEAFIFRELHRLATTYVQRSERDSSMLGVEGIVNDSITRLGGSSLKLEDQHHFYLVAAGVMRRVLVQFEQERRENNTTATTDASVLSLKETDLGTSTSIDIVDLNQSVERLQAQAPDAARVFELRYFAGLTRQQIADYAPMPVATVTTLLRFAKAWVLTQARQKRMSCQ